MSWDKCKGYSLQMEATELAILQTFSRSVRNETLPKSLASTNRLECCNLNRDFYFLLYVTKLKHSPKLNHFKEALH